MLTSSKVEEEILFSKGTGMPGAIFYGLMRYAVEQSKNYIPTMEMGTHRTGVNDTQLDFNIIMLSIVSISWAVRMRKIKSEEGQCHTHTTNCSETRKLHSNIYHKWIDVIEEALEALRSDPPSIATLRNGS